LFEKGKEPLLITDDYDQELSFPNLESSINSNNQASWKGCDRKRTQLNLLFFTVPTSLPRFESLKKLKVLTHFREDDSAFEVSLPHLEELEVVDKLERCPKLA
jgi:hypothetical protein